MRVLRGRNAAFGCRPALTPVRTRFPGPHLMGVCYCKFDSQVVGLCGTVENAILVHVAPSFREASAPPRPPRLKAGATSIPPGNGPARPVHLTSAKVKCLSVLRVDLGVRRWYQKQAGVVGVLPNSWSRAPLFCQAFLPSGRTVGRGACRKLDHR